LVKIIYSVHDEHVEHLLQDRTVNNVLVNLYITRIIDYSVLHRMIEVSVE